MSQRGREGREETANRRGARGTPLCTSLTHAMPAADSPAIFSHVKSDDEGKRKRPTARQVPKEV